MTSKTGIRVGRPFLVTTMLLRSPCRTRVRRLTLPFGDPSDCQKITRSRTLGASASSAEASLFVHSARFFNDEEVR